MGCKIAIAAGGSGGHLIPAQQLAEKLMGQNCEVRFAGYHLEKSPFFRREEFPFQEIASAPLTKNPFFFLASINRGFFQSLIWLIKEKPDVVVGFGSYHTFPVLLAAAVLRKKIVLFEPNCVLGKVNRIFAPVADYVAIQFPLERKLRNEKYVSPFPWGRKETALKSAADARAILGLKDLPTLLIFGGSQGAAALNEIFAQAALLLKKQGLEFQLIHLAGKEEAAEALTKSYREANIAAYVRAFEKNMELIYAAADLAVCRSGAATLCELIRFAKPSLLIPFPFAADDHQRKNGDYFVKSVGGAKMALQKEMTPEKLALEITSLLQSLEKYKDALKMYKCLGQVDLSDMIIEVAK